VLPDRSAMGFREELRRRSFLNEVFVSECRLVTLRWLTRIRHTIR
jgi:hypothetical protein